MKTSEEEKNHSHEKGSWISGMVENSSKEPGNPYMGETSCELDQKENIKLRINSHICPRKHKGTQVHSNGLEESTAP